MSDSQVAAALNQHFLEKVKRLKKDMPVKKGDAPLWGAKKSRNITSSEKLF